MPEVIVTHVFFGRSIPLEDLCEPMKELIKGGAGAHAKCHECGTLMTNVPIEGRGGVAASFPDENMNTCSVYEIAKNQGD